MTAISDKDFYNLTVSINKALNPMEAPLKTKHARSVIIMTHRTKEAKSLWTLITRQPLMENRFTAWKFCHLLHKVLREGHGSVLKHSQTHKKLILEMGKLWGHLQDGVGNCIQAYSKLLVTKLEFHDKNSIFPGALTIDFREVENYAGADINVYFQLCVEIFDYLDDIIELQSRVFSTINTYRMTSMTPQGQCRLAPLITLIQDSNPLYDLCVRIMFKLHDALPNDVLVGHRDRFRDLFVKIKYFYDNVRPLQYFADLIQVPFLPETAPNFCSKVDFGSYVPPVVLVQPDPEPMMENLVDVKHIAASEAAMPQDNDLYYLENVVREKEHTINQLKMELNSTRSTLSTIENNFKSEASHLREQVSYLNGELGSSKEICGNMQRMNEELETKLMEMMELSQKSTEEEEKVRASEEKFQKLKIMYTQIRDEHINLLRQQSEANKLLKKEKFDNDKLKTEIQELQTGLAALKEEEKNNQLICIKQTELETELKKVKLENDALQSSYTDETQKYHELEDRKNIEIKELSAQLSELKEEMIVMETYKSKVISSLEEEKNSNQLICIKQNELESALQKVKAEYDQLQASYTDLNKNYNELNKQKNIETEELTARLTKLKEEVAVLETYKSKVAVLEKSLEETEICLQTKSEQHSSAMGTYESNLQDKIAVINDLQNVRDLEAKVNKSKIDDFEQRIVLMTTELKEKEQVNNKLTQDKLLAENEVQDLLQQNSVLNNELKAVKAEADIVLSEKQNNEIKYDCLIRSLHHCFLTTVNNIFATKFKEPNQPSLEKSLCTIEATEKLLDEQYIVYNKYAQDNNCLEGLFRKSAMLSYQFIMLHEQCINIYNTTTNIEKGEDICNEITNIVEPLCQLFDCCQHPDKAEQVEQSIVQLKIKLGLIRQLVEEVKMMQNPNADLSDLVENELHEMDRAIEEAAAKFVQLLSNTRAKDDKIKLEVNEKILDACTNLLSCIKQLIRKSKMLQEEIVSSGRGNATAKEFYKRNSQWTEGLISASKSVAKGANLLVEAANKAVTSEVSQNFEIIVAAQEIAACTAQLVIASKVKASRQSQKLQDLTSASRSVSQATGVVVATVKDCNQHLEQLQEVDVTKLTSSQAKTMEMEIHVKVLELEQALQMERLKLASFRRSHYQNNDD